uniref:(California timema) hypothetical protein n=2 Tax=Timema TaxID=61471 RepID=A0A7R9P9M0_TIMCA|nr:unnamed protein product [Timema californicum]
MRGLNTRGVGGHASLEEQQQNLMALQDSSQTEDYIKALHENTLSFYQKWVNSRLDKSKLEEELTPQINCRVCWESDEHETFLTLCRCKGTSAHIHRSCLEKWLAKSDTSHCEICGYSYNIIRTPRYNVRESIPIWLKRGAHRDLLFDAISFFAFAPLAVVSTYLGVVVSLHHFDLGDSVEVDMPRSHMVTAGVLGLMLTLDYSFMLWLFTRVRHHRLRWYLWWRRHSVVKVVVPLQTSYGEMVEDGNKEGCTLK